MEVNAIARQRVNCKGLWPEEKEPEGLTVLTWLPLLLASQYLGFLTWLRSQFLLEKGICVAEPRPGRAGPTCGDGGVQISFFIGEVEAQHGRVLGGLSIYSECEAVGRL